MAGVARVHRDEDAARRLEPDRVPLKEESGDLGEERLPDGEQLLRDDREHLDVDPVELVEARPAARLRHAREELAHHLVVELVGAVEDDALDGDALGEVLGRLGLARACGARGRRAELDMQAARDGEPAAVGKRRNHEAREAALVLAPVEDLCVHLAHD